MIFVFLFLTYFTQYESPSSIQVAANGIILFFFMAEQYSMVYIYHTFLIQSSVDGHLGCFHVLAIVNSAAMNMRVHVPFSRKVLSGYMPKSGIAGSYGSSIFSFLRYQTFFPSRNKLPSDSQFHQCSSKFCTYSLTFIFKS